jgi:hypothetical protein
MFGIAGYKKIIQVYFNRTFRFGYLNIKGRGLQDFCLLMHSETYLHLRCIFKEYINNCIKYYTIVYKESPLIVRKINS